jgi:hypothetical protein
MEFETQAETCAYTYTDVFMFLIMPPLLTGNGIICQHVASFFLNPSGWNLGFHILLYCGLFQ